MMEKLTMYYHFAQIDASGNLYLYGRLSTPRELADAFNRLQHDHLTCIKQFNERNQTLEKLVGELSDDKHVVANEHVIEFRENGWTIKHPLICRPNLFDCEVNRAAERDIDGPPQQLGRFVCGITGGKFWCDTKPLTELEKEGK